MEENSRIKDEKCAIKFWIVIGWQTLKAFIYKGFRNRATGSNPPLPTTKKHPHFGLLFGGGQRCYNETLYYRWFVRMSKNCKVYVGYTGYTYERRK